jgi:hypothetical protein
LKDREEILAVLGSYKQEFERLYGVTDLGIFGSAARGEAGPESDVDVVVRMREPDLFHMVHIKEALEGALHSPVDIVRYRDSMNPFLKKRIDRDAVYV